MITTNQFMFASACLFMVAMIGGCTTTNSVATDNESSTPTAATIADVTDTEAVAPPAMVEVAAAEPTAAEAAQEVTQSAAPEVAKNDAPKVVTTENDVTIIPLGTTPEKVAAATAKPATTPNIPNIAKELANHHNTQWHSRSLTYRLYLGGQLNAEYSQEKDALTISADSGEAQLDCSYSTKNGGLNSVNDSQVNACNTLANDLQSYLVED